MGLTLHTFPSQIIILDESENGQLLAVPLLLAPLCFKVIGISSRKWASHRAYSWVYKTIVC